MHILIAGVDFGPHRVQIEYAYAVKWTSVPFKPLHSSSIDNDSDSRPICQMYLEFSTMLNAIDTILSRFQKLLIYSINSYLHGVTWNFTHEWNMHEVARYREKVPVGYAINCR